MYYSNEFEFTSNRIVSLFLMICSHYTNSMQTPHACNCNRPTHMNPTKLAATGMGYEDAPERCANVVALSGVGCNWDGL